MFLELIKTIGESFGTIAKPIGVKDSINGYIVAPKALEDGTLRVVSKDYLYYVSEGEIAGHSTNNIYVSLLTTSGTKLRFANGGYVEQSTGAQRSVVSSSASDSSAGTGIRTIRIHYIDSSDAEATEDLTLNGTTAVNTVSTTIKHINSIKALTAGSAGVAVGTIYLLSTINAGGTPICQIQIGNIETKLAHYYVATGKSYTLNRVLFCCQGTNTLILSANNGSGLFGEIVRVILTDSYSEPVKSLIKVDGPGKVIAYYSTSNNNRLVSAVLEGWVE